MRTARAVLLLSMVAFAVPAVIAGTRVGIIHEERLKLSPVDRKRLVIQDLSSILTGPASTTGIATQSYPSVEPRLCRRDVIELSYAQAGSGKNLGYKPQGVKSVGVQYHYLDLSGAQSLADRRKACAGLGRAQNAWVASQDDEHYVSSALTRLAEALADVRTSAHVTLSCEDKALDCAKQFLTAARQISAAHRCADLSVECYEYFMGDWHARIVTDYTGTTRHTTIKLVVAGIVVT